MFSVLGLGLAFRDQRAIVVIPKSAPAKTIYGKKRVKVRSTSGLMKPELKENQS